MTISELGTSCMNTLNDLVDKSSSSKEDGRHALVDDFRGRFRIWAANIGALRPESSPKSLDYRVREADDMKSSIMSGLGRIKESGTSGKVKCFGYIYRNDSNYDSSQDLIGCRDQQTESREQRWTSRS